MIRAKRKIIKFSNYSLCITLPKKAVEALGWEKGQEVSVNFDSKAKKINIFKPRHSQNASAKTKVKKTGAKVKSIPRLRW